MLHKGVLILKSSDFNSEFKPKRQSMLQEAGDKLLPSLKWNVTTNGLLWGIILEGVLSAIKQTMELTQATIARGRNYSFVLLNDE